MGFKWIQILPYFIAFTLPLNQTNGILITYCFYDLHVVQGLGPHLVHVLGPNLVHLLGLHVVHVLGNSPLHSIAV